MFDFFTFLLLVFSGLKFNVNLRPSFSSFIFFHCAQNSHRGIHARKTNFIFIIILNVERKCFRIFDFNACSMGDNWGMTFRLKLARMQLIGLLGVKEHYAF